MKKLSLVILLAVLCLFARTPSANAYFGFSTGLTDNNKYGYGLNFGFYTPGDFGLDMQLISNYDNQNSFSKYGFQENASVFYDFHNMLKAKSREFSNAHPYFKIGFSYGVDVLSSISISNVQYSAQLSEGPGMNFGGGCDWRLAPGLSLGLDLFESILWLNGATAGGTVLAADETRYGFNLLLTFKFYDIVTE